MKKLLVCYEIDMHDNYYLFDTVYKSSNFKTHQSHLRHPIYNFYLKILQSAKNHFKLKYNTIF